MNIIPLICLALANVTMESPDGSMYAVIEYYPGTVLWTEHFTLYTRTGDRIYRINDHPAHTYFICNTGNLYAMNERDLWFFDRNGKEIWHRSLHAVNTSGFSADNTVFFLSEKSGIRVYDNDGNVEHDLPPGRLFSSVNKGDLIAVVSSDTAYYYEHGELVHTIPLSSPYVWQIAFSDDHTTIEIEYVDHLEIIDCATGTRRIP